MATKAGFNPLVGREQDVLSMCEHFLEDDKILDSPTKYHKKLAILMITVALLKHLYGDELDLDHVVDFLTNSEVMERDLHEVELRGSKTDREAAHWFEAHFNKHQEEYDRIISELAQELSKLPH